MIRSRQQATLRSFTPEERRCRHEMVGVHTHEHRVMALVPTIPDFAAEKMRVDDASLTPDEEAACDAAIAAARSNIRIQVYGRDW